MQKAMENQRYVRLVLLYTSSGLLIPWTDPFGSPVGLARKAVLEQSLNNVIYETSNKNMRPYVHATGW